MKFDRLQKSNDHSGEEDEMSIKIRDDHPLNHAMLVPYMQLRKIKVLRSLGNCSAVKIAEMCFVR